MIMQEKNTNTEKMTTEDGEKIPPLLDAPQLQPETQPNNNKEEGEGEMMREEIQDYNEEGHYHPDHHGGHHHHPHHGEHHHHPYHPHGGHHHNHLHGGHYHHDHHHHHNHHPMEGCIPTLPPPPPYSGYHHHPHPFQHQHCGAGRMGMMGYHFMMNRKCCPPPMSQCANVYGNETRGVFVPPLARKPCNRVFVRKQRKAMKRHMKVMWLQKKIARKVAKLHNCDSEKRRHRLTKKVDRLREKLQKFSDKMTPSSPNSVPAPAPPAYPHHGVDPSLMMMDSFPFRWGSHHHGGRRHRRRCKKHKRDKNKEKHHNKKHGASSSTSQEKPADQNQDDYVYADSSSSSSISSSSSD